MGFNTLTFEKLNHVGLLRFNRPAAMNALNAELIKELNLFLTEIEKSNDLRVLVFTGAGEKAFIAGADIKEINSLTLDQVKIFSEYGQKTLSRFENLPIPIIAAINGFALGGGLEVALACDFIWASQKAKLGLPEVSLGIMPGYGGTQRLARWVGCGRACEMTYSGQFYSADEAYSFGLVQKVLPPEALLPETLKFAELISTRGPLAVAACKKAIKVGTEASLDKGLQLEASEFTNLFKTADKNEGTQAFIEKRTPQFKGQ